ncbi:hypothetical protein AB1K83_05240 [Sporosarcina sp. 179-K 3D1 HS]|uniref:hypothetical protein n=1 Tax=Sporosarcina sp. 179-K 3D1 HS TaxID=3232169 RepID=UPI0039A0399E
MKAVRQGCLGIITLIILLVGVVIVYWNFGWPWNYIEEKKALHAAAEEKYGKEFTMKKMVFDVMHGSEYYGYATDEDGVLFYVGFEDGKFDDSYLHERWDYELKKEIEPIIRPFFTDADSVIVSVGSVENKKDTGSSIPDYKESVTVELGANMSEVTVQDVEAELDRVWQAVEAIQEAGARVSAIHIGYENKVLNYRNELTTREELNGFLVDYAR